jgi:hypothetical protein
MLLRISGEPFKVLWVLSPSILGKDSLSQQRVMVGSKALASFKLLIWLLTSNSYGPIFSEYFEEQNAKKIHGAHQVSLETLFVGYVPI